MRCVWILVLAACGSSKKPASTAGPYDSPTGDGKPAVLSVESKDPPARTPTKALDGRLRIQPSGMCGGAVPPPDYQDPPLAPADSVALEISAGTAYSGKPPVATVTTDKDGNFAVDLPAGTYCITMHGRGPKPKDMGKYYDLDCLVKTWEMCDAIAEVPVKKVVAIDHEEPCAGMVCYHGPPPP